MPNINEYPIRGVDLKQTYHAPGGEPRQLVVFDLSGIARRDNLPPVSIHPRRGGHRAPHRTALKV